MCTVIYYHCTIEHGAFRMCSRTWPALNKYNVAMCQVAGSLSLLLAVSCNRQSTKQLFAPDHDIVYTELSTAILQTNREPFVLVAPHTLIRIQWGAWTQLPSRHFSAVSLVPLYSLNAFALIDGSYGNNTNWIQLHSSYASHLPSAPADTPGASRASSKSQVSGPSALFVRPIHQDLPMRKSDLFIPLWYSTLAIMLPVAVDCDE